MQERGVVPHMSCYMLRFEHEVTFVWRGRLCHVFMTCAMCQQDVSVRYKLGGRYVRRGETTGMFGGLQGTSSNVAEWLGSALEGYEKLLDVGST